MMTLSTAQTDVAAPSNADKSRLDYLDAPRAFALVLGIVFHACLSFVPVFMGWAVQDISTSPLVTMFMTVSHSFRMEAFFLIAGFLSHLSFHRKGAGEFVRSRALRIIVPFAVGWFILRPLVISGWIMGYASLHGRVDIWAGLWGGLQTLKTLPTGIFTGSHLWFLYYVALITGLTLAARGMLTATGSWRIKFLRSADSAVAWLANSPVSLPILTIPTAAILWFMRSWGMDTPDKSLLPESPPLAIYGGFFLFGWMLHRQRELISQFARITLERWILAALGVTVILLLGGIAIDPSHPHYVGARVGYAGAYALTMWSLVFLTIGVFKKLFQQPNAFIRYVADSSYWMYLVHLPIVIWLQVAFAELSLNWSLKLVFICTITIAFSLLTYDLFVRSTFVGWVLNGRRRDRVTPRVLRSAVNLCGGKRLKTFIRWTRDIPAA